MKASVFIATSLDGFIARENGGIDWLPTGDASGSGEDYGYKQFMDSVDVLVMGRNSFETVLSFGGEWPYGRKPVIVLSNWLTALPSQVPDSVELMSCSPHDLIERLEKRGVKHLYVDGGKTIQAFLRAGLIQQLIITRIPVLLGSGIPLFGPLERDVNLHHIETRSYPNGFVQSRYEC